MARTLALTVLMLLLGARAAAGQAAGRNVEILAHVNEFPTVPGSQPWPYSACWSYVHPDGREYAVLGFHSGTAIYNITDPVHPYRVAQFDGPTSIWREMKSYRNWIYVVSEGNATARGLQIIRMTDPENPRLANTYTQGFLTSHTIQIDTTRAVLVCNGTRDAFGRQAGMRILSIADPEHPVEITFWPDGWQLEDPALYVHDCVIRGLTMYASCIYAGVVRVFDFSEPSLPVEQATLAYDGAYYTHSAWPDSGGGFLYVADEQNGQPLRVFPTHAGPQTAALNAITCNPRAIVHNPRVRGHELYLANYTEGVRVLDVRDPLHPAEFAWLDTWPGPSGGYGGVWEVCPYFPSGVVIASDMRSGLWIFRPRREGHGRFEVTVAGAATATLRLGSDSLTTHGDGAAQTFAVEPGSHTVQVRAYGFHDDSVTRTLAAGGIERATVTLRPRARVSFAGTVRDLHGGEPLDEAVVTLRHGPLHAHTGPDGRFALEDVPADRYRVEVRRAGYAPFVAERDLGVWRSEAFALQPARRWDPIASAAGWVVGAPGDGVAQGEWVHATPVAAGAPVGPAARSPSPFRLAHESPALMPDGAAPLLDHSPGPDSLCFVTGQAPDTLSLFSGALSRGRTTLTTPELDLTGMADPVVGYWRWFLSQDLGTGQPDAGDWLEVAISADGGGTWVRVDSLGGQNQGWKEAAVRVADHVVPSARVRLRFRAVEIGARSLARVAVDDLVAYDRDEIRAPAPGPWAGLRIETPWPNPSTGDVRLTVRVPTAGALQASVVDVAGREVRRLHRGPVEPGLLPLSWDGTDRNGRRVRAGLYFVLASQGGAEVAQRIVRMR